MKKLNTISLNEIRLTDDFFGKYTELVTKEIIPYQWRVLNNREPSAEKSNCIENFKIASGEAEGEFYGFVFQDTDLAKWLEAVAYSLSYEKNEELERMADQAIELIGRAQRPDGYLDTYFIIKEPEGKFTNLREGHELYTAGHFMEAAVAYYEVTGKDRLLSIMEKNADLICETFHTKVYETAVPGHQEVEIGLIRLYEATGKEKYLAMAKDFIDRRGTEPNYLIHEHEHQNWTDVFHNPDPFFPAYSQCDEPVRQQKTARGHAVRAVYMYCAMADLAAAYDDKELLDTCRTLYRNITERQMYLTGGIGSSGIYERFTVDYDLPNDRNYAESCASIGLALFCRRMAQITHETRYLETMETALYNTVLAGIAMDGKSFFYVNPLEVVPEFCMDFSSIGHVKPVRQKWFGCACCPPNIARTLASLGAYLCFTEEKAVYLNLHVSCSFSATISGKTVRFSVKTRMPFYGETELSVDNPEQTSGTVFIRIPAYAKDPLLQCDEGEVMKTDAGIYAAVPLTKELKTIRLRFSMPAEYVYADPQVRADVGKVAVKKGPLVYAMEEADNGKNLAAFFADTGIQPKEVFEKELLGGTMTLLVEGWRLLRGDGESGLYRIVRPERERTSARLIPYCYWNNRQPGEMLVWMREA
ncbi:MAG: glycoside hydrolase family 127 protein [Lachnospiraceae bacterium]|nr:glycoside hydrolase family 127 protein [Lachnospiraceae bacterium]